MVCIQKIYIYVQVQQCEQVMKQQMLLELLGRKKHLCQFVTALNTFFSYNAVSDATLETLRWLTISWSQKRSHQFLITENEEYKQQNCVTCCGVSMARVLCHSLLYTVGCLTSCARNCTLCPVSLLQTLGYVGLHILHSCGPCAGGHHDDEVFLGSGNRCPTCIAEAGGSVQV